MQLELLRFNSVDGRIYREKVKESGKDATHKHIQKIVMEMNADESIVMSISMFRTEELTAFKTSQTGDDHIWVYSSWFNGFFPSPQELVENLKGAKVYHVKRMMPEHSEDIPGLLAEHYKEFIKDRDESLTVLQDFFTWMVKNGIVEVDNED